MLGCDPGVGAFRFLPIVNLLTFPPNTETQGIYFFFAAVSTTHSCFGLSINNVNSTEIIAASTVSSNTFRVCVASRRRSFIYIPIVVSSDIKLSVTEDVVYMYVSSKLRPLCRMPSCKPGIGGLHSLNIISSQFPLRPRPCFFCPISR